MQIDVLDDWAGVARNCVDWDPLKKRCLVVFHEAPLSKVEGMRALAKTTILLPMRERTIIDKSMLDKMPRLQMIALTGATTRHVDLREIHRRGIVLCWSGQYYPEETAEFAFGLMLAAEKNIVRGAAAIRSGGFMTDTGLGRRLSGRVMGILGLGNIGSRLARLASAMDMKVMAWSKSLTPERAAAHGAISASLDEVILKSDILSLNMTMSEATRGLIGARELALMKPGALLLNTARSALVDETALIIALKRGNIRAALDVFEEEPLPCNHSFRTLSNVTLTPHMGYATVECMEMFYSECVENIHAWLDGAPMRLLDQSAAKE
ncbi:MAG: D-2-hydroxyacid dehydrogenase family protein [Alphaproteobacteria bacterium]|nr:D-2-hydroxyacid dehydrogenase family protein [Alphaproteobacteria bacterium]